jgi:hypothetical protein
MDMRVSFTRYTIKSSSKDFAAYALAPCGSFIVILFKDILM